MRTNGKPVMQVATPQSQVLDGEFEDVTSRALTTVSPPATTSRMLALMSLTALQVQKPRVMSEVLNRVLAEAELAGKDFYYSWTQGGKLIEGMSIDGGMILVRNFGNCLADSEVYQEGPTFWLFDAVFVDKETGFALRRQFRQRKSESHQKVGKDGDADRLVDIAFQIGISKAQRNVIEKSMPAWLVKRAMEKAKEGELSAYGDIPKWVENAKAAYAKLKVTVPELEKKIGRPTSLWTSEDIRILVAIQRAIVARETTADREFRAQEPAPAAAPAVQSVTADGEVVAEKAEPAAASPAASAAGFTDEPSGT